MGTCEYSQRVPSLAPACANAPSSIKAIWKLDDAAAANRANQRRIVAEKDAGSNASSRNCFPGCRFSSSKTKSAEFVPPAETRAHLLIVADANEERPTFQ